ncbi:MAG: protein kinase [Parachlamydiaceae bacterium]|nr:MAG: protein kinase [Parachlamydiaceae bacterium]
MKGLIEQDKNYILPEELLNGMTSVAQGLAAMHSRDFIHRDIALRNILVTDQTEFKTNADSKQIERKYDLRFAISDFGRMKQLEGQETARLEGNLHPITWMPPEELFEAKSSKKVMSLVSVLPLWKPY